MAHHLDRVSLSIVLSGEYFKFDCRYLLGSQPFKKPELRFYIHECIHLWQILGSGYLSSIARNKWLALQHWETTGQLPNPDDHFTTVEPSVGFSARDLSEGLCRFWDVHISGPPDLLDEPYAGDPINDLADVPPDWLTAGLDPEIIERIRNQRSYTGAQYDEWMLHDTYAEPYRQLVKLGGSKWAAALFPIIGYFALQTPSPPRAFAGSLELLTEYPLPDNCRYIHDTWRMIFRDVANACGRAAFTRTFTLLTPGANAIKVMAREGHIVYQHYLSLLAMANEAWPTDVRLALPGDPAMRLQLSTFFLPPVVNFDDGRWTPDSVAVKMGLARAVPGLLPQPQLADASEDLYARCKAMGKAVLLAEK